MKGNSDPTEKVYQFDGNFYDALDELVDNALWGFDFIEEIPDSFEIEYWECTLEPFCELCCHSLTNIIIEAYLDRCSDWGDEYDIIKEALKQSVDFNKLQELMPMLWYPCKESSIITKEDIINNYSHLF